MRRVWQAWSEFWFSPQSLLNIALFRILLCSTMAMMYLDRLWDWKTFYTEEGMLPRALALKVIPEFYRPYWTSFFWPDSMSFLFHLLLVIGLILLSLGLGGRILHLVVWLLHIGFLQRNFSIAFGADLVGGIFLLYLIFTQSCKRLSLWNLIRSKSNADLRPDILNNIFSRMIQIQLCVIYAFTGFEKLKGASWWDGTALWSVMANPQMVVADFYWMRYFPWLIPILGFCTILFEIYFPLLVWNVRFRRAVLFSGVVFHLGIGLLMALYSFALVMISGYILFVPEETWRKSLLRFKLRRN